MKQISIGYLPSLDCGFGFPTFKGILDWVETFFIRAAIWKPRIASIVIQLLSNISKKLSFDVDCKIAKSSLENRPGSFFFVTRKKSTFWNAVF